MSRYSDLPNEAQQLVARGLQALVRLKQEELELTKQSTIVVQAVIAYPNQPEKWPLSAPWPEGFVVQREDGQFLCLNSYKHPRDWSPLLKDAYIWRIRDMAVSATGNADTYRCAVWLIEDICTTIGVTS